MSAFLIPDIIAHRGASNDAPENTLAAFRLALKKGADGIEGDFRVTRDGEIVCIHDATTDRVSGENLRVSECKLRELRKLDIGAWKGKKWAGERIPTLQEVLAVVPEKKKLYIEIKCGPEIFAPLAAVLSQSSIAPEQLVLISFSNEVIFEAKQRFPDIRALWIVEFGPSEFDPFIQPSVQHVVKELHRINADGLDAEGHPMVDVAFANTLKQKNLELHIWSPNKASDLKRFQQLGVASITTNFPEKLRVTLSTQ